MLDEVDAGLTAGLRVKVRCERRRLAASGLPTCGCAHGDRPCPGLEQVQAERREPQAPGDIDAVAWPGAGAGQRLPVFDFTGSDHIDHDRPVRSDSRVATDQLDFDALRQRTHAVVKGRDPPTWGVSWDGKREQGEFRPGAHGGQITQGAGEGAMPDGSRRMKPNLKVDAFKGEIGGENQIDAGSGADHGGVIADAKFETRSPIRPAAAQPADKLTLAPKGHPGSDSCTPCGLADHACDRRRPSRLRPDLTPCGRAELS